MAMTGKKAAKKPATETAKKANTKLTTPNLHDDSKPYIARPSRFIDLFCGIGGFRIAFEKAGRRCAC